MLNCGLWFVKILFVLYICILIKIIVIEMEKFMIYFFWDVIYRRYDKMNINNLMFFSLRILFGCRLRGDWELISDGVM